MMKISVFTLTTSVLLLLHCTIGTVAYGMELQAPNTHVKITLCDKATVSSTAVFAYPLNTCFPGDGKSKYLAKDLGDGTIELELQTTDSVCDTFFENSIKKVNGTKGSTCDDQHDYAFELFTDLPPLPTPETNAYTEKSYDKSDTTCLTMKSWAYFTPDKCIKDIEGLTTWNYADDFRSKPRKIIHSSFIFMTDDCSSRFREFNLPDFTGLGVCSAEHNPIYSGPYGSSFIVSLNIVEPLFARVSFAGTYDDASGTEVGRVVAVPLNTCLKYGYEGTQSAIYHMFDYGNSLGRFFFKTFYTVDCTGNQDQREDFDNIKLRVFDPESKIEYNGPVIKFEPLSSLPSIPSTAELGGLGIYQELHYSDTDVNCTGPVVSWMYTLPDICISDYDGIFTEVMSECCNSYAIRLDGSTFHSYEEYEKNPPRCRTVVSGYKIASGMNISPGVCKTAADNLAVCDFCGGYFVASFSPKTATPTMAPNTFNVINEKFIAIDQSLKSLNDMSSSSDTNFASIDQSLKDLNEKSTKSDTNFASIDKSLKDINTEISTLQQNSNSNSVGSSNSNDDSKSDPKTLSIAIAGLVFAVVLGSFSTGVSAYFLVTNAYKPIPKDEGDVPVSVEVAEI